MKKSISKASNSKLQITNILRNTQLEDKDMKNRILQLSIYERQITKSCKKHSGGNHWKNVTFHNFGITNVKEDRADKNCKYFRDTSLHKPSKKESSTSKVSNLAPLHLFLEPHIIRLRSLASCAMF